MGVANVANDDNSPLMLKELHKPRDRVDPPLSWVQFKEAFMGRPSSNWLSLLLSNLNLTRGSREAQTRTDVPQVHSEAAQTDTAAEVSPKTTLREVDLRRSP